MQARTACSLAATLLDAYTSNLSRTCTDGIVDKLAAPRRKSDLLADLKNCSRTGNLERGRNLHGEAAACGHDSDIFVQGALITMYAKCGSITESRQVFDSMQRPDAVAWNALIAGYAENGEGLTALDLFARMRIEGLEFTSVTIVAALKACTTLAGKGTTGSVECADRGYAIHNLAVQNGSISVIYVQNMLLDMYSNCFVLSDAHRVFAAIEQPNVVSWTALILGYAESGEGSTALDLFARMRIVGPPPNSVTFVAVLKACTTVSSLEECSNRGSAIHRLAVDSGCASDIYVQNTLIDMYSKSCSMVESRKVFDFVDYPNVVSWNALIMGYAEFGDGQTALHLFARMKCRGPAANSVTLVAALKACASLATNEGATELEECRSRGRALHRLAVESGCNSNIYFESALISMYAKCGSMQDARQVFVTMNHPDCASWNALILGYANIGEGQSALDLFTLMERGGLAPTCVTFMAALKACGSVRGTVSTAQDQAKALHRLAVERGCTSDIHVRNTLIDTYCKCSSMVNARQQFDSMQDRDVVSWNALLSGYADTGQGHLCLELFTRMRTEGPAPTPVTFAAALKACTLLGALEIGRAIHHSEIRELDDVVLVTTLVDFYAKCGSLVEARCMFDSHSTSRNVATWNALLAGYSSRGDDKSVFELLEGMQDAGFRPDGVTLLSILTCCSHSGLVDKGKECFDSMYAKFRVTPTIEHYNCMLDIFVRANKADDAIDLLEHMPCTPNNVTWMTASRTWI